MLSYGPGAPSLRFGLDALGAAAHGRGRREPFHLVNGLVFHGEVHLDLQDFLGVGITDRSTFRLDKVGTKAEGLVHGLVTPPPTHKYKLARDPDMSLVSNYRVITGKYRRILRFLVFLLRYSLYHGKDGIIVRRLENSG